MTAAKKSEMSLAMGLSSVGAAEVALLSFDGGVNTIDDSVALWARIVGGL